MQIYKENEALHGDKIWIPDAASPVGLALEDDGEEISGMTVVQVIIELKKTLEKAVKK